VSLSTARSILFVCMGNICRSPMAEAMFRHQATLRGVLDEFTIDSAGTGGWHAGSPPDDRMQRTAQRHGIPMKCRARKVRNPDFTSFDLILCMDEENHANLLKMGAPPDRLRLMLDFHPHEQCTEVPDPYYGEHDGFQEVFDLLETSCDRLLDELLPESS
jgi:protein-tyrosine phosphatase